MGHHGTDGRERGREVVGAERPVPASDLSSSSTSEREHLHGDVQSKGSGPQAVRWLQKSRGCSHLAGHTLFSWPHSSLVSPNLPNWAESTLHARVARGQPHARKGCAAKPFPSQASTAKPHGAGAAALCHTEQGKRMGKREESALCQGEQIHAASVQILQPSAEAGAALCSARALGSARAWSDRKQKERVNNGGVLKLLFQLYLALTLHRAIA